MLSSSLDALLKLSKTTSPNKLFDYDYVTLYKVYAYSELGLSKLNCYFFGGGVDVTICPVYIFF